MSKTICCFLAAGAVWGLATARGAEPPARFLGANSCASSSCHGGGGASQNQFLVWSLKDFHSQRPVATLATARAKQIADALQIKDASVDDRCTACHAPLQQVPANLRGEGSKVSEGVSCESCHGPAGNWIRSHTRPDYTHADRVAVGMRDLESLYVRANTCVACHQVVAEPLLRAGHPELIFELDGQSVAEPKHWRPENNGNGVQAWLVGQAVALRELTWQMTQMHPFNELPQRLAETNLAQRIYALSWLLNKATGEQTSPTTFPEDFESRQRMADKLAREKSEAAWPEQATRECLLRLANLAPDFLAKATPQPLQARRAERLVLGLDRLVAASPETRQNKPLNDALNTLFADAQSLPDFKPADFSAHLETFRKLIPASTP